MIVSPDMSREKSDHIFGLDGLRAISVLAVMLYHTHVFWMQGGYLGVEIFFVISGFLITRRLLHVREQLGLGFVPSLLYFWKRRIGRLFPSLALFLFVVAIIGAFILGPRSSQFRGDLLPSLLYVENWYQIISGGSYFANQGLPLLRHIWSLAVEEQFYLFWPLLVGAICTRKSGRNMMMLIAIALAVISFGLMVTLVDPWNSSSVQVLESFNRAYLGTDTRAFGLLIGALLALAPDMKQVKKISQWIVEAGALVALCSLIAMCVFVDIQDSFLYRGGFQIVDGLTVFLIAYLIGPGTGPVANLMRWRPIEWIGHRSYGIYLWHWLVFQLIGEGQSDAFWIIMRWGLTFIIAAATYKWMEAPILDWVRGNSRKVHARSHYWKLAAVTVGVLLLAVTTHAGIQIANMPPLKNEIQESLKLNEKALDTVNSSNHVMRTKQSAALLKNERQLFCKLNDFVPDAIILTKQAGKEKISALPFLNAASSPMQFPIKPRLKDKEIKIPDISIQGQEGDYITAIGDSVMKGAAIALKEECDAYLGPNHILINAEESRTFRRAYDIVKAYKLKNSLGNIVIIHLGANNSSIPDKDFQKLAELLADRELIIFLTAKSDKIAICDAVNARLEMLVRELPNAQLYDWKADAIQHPELFYSDNTHLRPKGARYYAASILTQVNNFRIKTVAHYSRY